MPFWQLFYHLVWSTKNREPLIIAEYEPLVYDLIVRKASSLGGKVFAIGGVEDHVHLAVAIPPSIAVATFVGQIKGASSAQINKMKIFPYSFRWQNEYGAFSFDRKRLPYVIQYIKGQKERHQTGTLIPVLERFDTSDRSAPVIREEMTPYLVDIRVWEEEMNSP